MLQCTLHRGNHRTTGWIPERGARRGAVIELLPSRELWTVAEVFDHTLPADVLREHQLLNRRSLPSIEAMV